MYLHNHSNFKDLIEITSRERKVNASLVEKDYWIMNVLHHLSKLFEFQMKGGTSLSKGLKMIDRFCRMSETVFSNRPFQNFSLITSKLSVDQNSHTLLSRQN